MQNPMMPPPDMGMVPPGPSMGPQPGGPPPDMGSVPPGPDAMLGSSPEMPPVTVPGWVPADPSTPIDETTCAEINAIPYTDSQGNKFCMVPPPGGPSAGPPPGGPPMGPLGPLG